MQDLFGLAQQGSGELVAFPEFVGIAGQVALPAHRAEQEAPLRVAVLRVERGLGHARQQALVAHELLVQGMAGRVDVIDASGIAAVDHEDEVRHLQRRAWVVDPGQLHELRAAVDALKVVWPANGRRCRGILLPVLIG